jgi:hypothetical protein
MRLTACANWPHLAAGCGGFCAVSGGREHVVGSRTQGRLPRQRGVALAGRTGTASRVERRSPMALNTLRRTSIGTTCGKPIAELRIGWQHGRRHR